MPLALRMNLPMRRASGHAQMSSILCLMDRSDFIGSNLTSEFGLYTIYILEFLCTG